jgi:type IV pilus assembly protein PilB
MPLSEAAVAQSRIGAMTFLAPETPLVSAESVAALEAALAACIASHQVHIIIDLSRVSLLAGRALELLARSSAGLIRLGGSLKIAYPSELVQEIFTATGLTDQIPAFDAPARPPARVGRKRKIGEILSEGGHASAAHIEEAVALQQKTGGQLGSILLEKKWVSEAALLQALAEQLSVPSISLRAGLYDPEAVQLLDRDTARRMHVLPMFRVDGTLTLATSDPQAIDSFDDVKALTGCKVRCVLATADEISRALDEAHGSSGLPAFVHSMADDLELVVNRQPDDYTVVDEMAGASPVVNLVNAVIQRAIRDNASDIHIEISRQRARIRLRIDGILYEAMSPRPELHPAIVSRLKVMANLDIAERRLPQDGRIQVFTQGRTVDLRFSSLPGIYGEKVVLRVLDTNQSILDLDKLGMAAPICSLFKKMLGRSHGLVLVTGPTGSGKTTSLYAAINFLKSIEKNIVTIEDPVEYQLDIINQNQINEAIGLSFPKILKHVLRQDPDIVMLGEIRDRETAEIAIQAALTGHLVLTTLHTNDTLGAVARLAEMGIEPYLLSSALVGVMAQRLVRKVCVSCKTTYVAAPEVAAACRWKGNGNLKLARGRGCPSCYDSGFRGRLGIYELVDIDADLRRMILADAGKDEMSRHLADKEHRDLYADVLQRVCEGSTTLDEVSRVIHAE